MAVKEMKTNEQIRVREVRLIGNEGDQLGVMAIADALQLAKDAGIDLVEIAPQANPPVCKILDYGKYRFEQEKKDKDSRKRQKLMKMKEIEQIVLIAAELDNNLRQAP